MKTLMYIYGWLFVRPRRWFFGNLLRASFGTRWWWERHDYLNDKGYRYFGPNVHWRVLYLTVWPFFKWIENRAWTKFCTYEKGWLKKKPVIASFVQWIGRTTVGQHIMSRECWHCGFERGNQTDLADDETGTTFILEDSGSSGSWDGTYHWFRGTTICPVCGYRSDYEDST